MYYLASPDPGFCLGFSVYRFASATAAEAADGGTLFRV